VIGLDDEDCDGATIDLGPYPFGVIPGDHGEGEWWLPTPIPAEEGALDLPPDWWAGCLEGFRLGLELGRQSDGAPAAEQTPPRRVLAEPTIRGRRWRS